ncbi:hypothetical protein [Halofilum ochraceum]|uniref:hypothetical protein n=1 Tax=Halofilum ochraceum TaxID=1611323 RepID=UPI0008D9F79F|nr:hypothetical protein [Halofilum ochraceum]
MNRNAPPAAAPSDAGGQGRAGRAETALLRAVLHILFGVWGLSVREVAPILGGVPLRTLFHWREHPEIAAIDTVLRHRLSSLLALHKALRRIHPDAAGQREWLRAPDTDGRTPVELLTDGRTRDIRFLRDRARSGTHEDEGAR